MRGFKYRISDFAAAVLMGQLERYEELCAKREAHAAYLMAELKRIPGFVVQENYPQSTRQNHYCFRGAVRPGAFQGLAQAKSGDSLGSRRHYGGWRLCAAQQGTLY